MSETTTIRVSMETWRVLTAMGRKGETFDAILVRLIEYHEQGVSAANALRKPVSDESKAEAEDR